MMTPRSKFFLLMVGLAIPYTSLVMYGAWRYGAQHEAIPQWFPLTCLAYMVAAVVFGGIFGRRLVRGQKVENEQALAAHQKNFALCIRLVLGWIAAFLFTLWKYHED